MQKLEAGSPEAKSSDLVAGNIEQLKALFPELITEGTHGVAVNLDVLKALVGDQTAADAEEKYGLNWHGKRRARQVALTPSTGTLRPFPSESVSWDTTQNLFIEGDNLEVLKLLQKSYAGKVKLIYIDPPYNTGKDFVYRDNFHDNVKNYLELTGQIESDQKISSNTETSGRFHTAWLNMFLPRLKLARDLLRKDGVIFISINDKELANLRCLGNEIFGEENFIASLVWEKGRKNDARRFSVGHEYVVGYARDLSHIEEILPPWREPKEGVAEIIDEYLRLKSIHGSSYERISEGLVAFYRELSVDEPSKKYSRSRFVDARGIWRDNNISWPGGGGPKYVLEHPVTKQPCKIPDDGWRFVEETMKRKIEDGYVQFREDHTKSPFLKSYLYIDDPSGGSEEDVAGEKLQVMGSVFYRHSQPSTDVMKEILGEKVFDNPKDHMILARLIRYCTGPEDLILDFFAGSGSTGHGVWELNAHEGGSRRFCLIQLPERLDAENADQKLAEKFCEQIGRPKTIAEITKERLRRAAHQLKSKYPKFSGDTGFRVFKLDQSNIRPWNPSADDLGETLLSHQEHLLEGRSESDILYELLIKLGLDLCVPIATRKLGGKVVHSVGGGVLMACLAVSIVDAEVETVAKGIIDWHSELAPAGETTCVFRDSAFADDVAKTNMAAILEQNGIQNVRSL
ncbi:site-specific DNA-methyltransferase [Paraburkholderia fungorum]|nr:site-specific DNA-methyltransferase [Paraburkholderia fungorum]